MEDFNNSFALLIGASSKGEEYMADDAKAIKEVLLDKKFAGYPKENVILLTDKKANRKNILNAFDSLAKKLNKDSNFLSSDEFISVLTETKSICTNKQFTEGLIQSLNVLRQTKIHI